MSLDKTEIRKKYSSFEDFYEAENGCHQCLCGCNEVIEIKPSHFWNGIPDYIFGHAARTRKGSMPFDTSRYYSVEDIARIADISDQTVRLWNRTGKIVAADTSGRKNLYLKDDIDTFLRDRPNRERFHPENYYSIQTLKQKGVSRAKLRALVRAGKIREPRHFSRKTLYLKSDIDAYYKDIVETKKAPSGRSGDYEEIIQALSAKLTDLEERVKLLEDSMLTG